MTTGAPRPDEPALCPACGYSGLILTYTGDALACVLPDCNYRHAIPELAQPKEKP